MSLKVVVKEMPTVLLTFDELPLGEIYRRDQDPRIVVKIKVTASHYSILSDGGIRPTGGFWEVSPSGRDHRVYIPIKATLTIEG